MGQIALNPARNASGSLIFPTGNQNFRGREMGQAASMIGMQMRKHNPANVPRRNPNATQLWTNLVIWTNVWPCSKPEKRMPAWEVAFLGGAGGFASVHDNNAFRVLNDPGIDWKRLSPFFTGKDIQESLTPLASSTLLRDFDANGPCLKSMDADHDDFSPLLLICVLL
jgi:hypothetical protein